MPAIARVGDIGVGVCYSHSSPTPYTTVFSSGADSVLINHAPGCVVGSTGAASCGHPTIALTGSPDVFMEESPAHRVGDTGANGGPYVVASGSPDVFANE